jgi:signal transduction histidine kinase
VPLLTDESIAAGDTSALTETLDRQSAWSDLPIVLLCGTGADPRLVAWALEVLGNVTILERPVRVTTLVSTLRAACRARRRQYELRESDQRKDEFLATLSHELRNPLAPLRNSLHLLRVTGEEQTNITRLRSDGAAG